MRSFLCIILALFLAACEEPSTGLNCSSLKFGDMTPEQQKASVEYCSVESKVKETDTMADRIGREAEARGQTIDEFVETPLGMVILAKELAATIVALVTILGMWVIGNMFLRLTAWEEKNAKRKKWGPFSYWEIEYTARRDTFMDISSSGWLFIFGLVSLVVGLIIYGSVAN